MEPSHEEGLLEDLVSPMRKSLTTFPSEEFTTGLFPGVWNYFEPFDQLNNTTTHHITTNYSNPSFLQLITSSSSSSVVQPTFNFPYNNGNYPFDHYDISAPPIHSSSYDNITHEQQRPLMEAQEGGQLVGGPGNNAVEQQQVNEERNNKSKKVEGKPSKNLLAERRRRKRLNERLSMLRSIVPKISKMDRTSILGDTVDYMKELLQKIHTLKDNNIETGRTDQMDIGGSIKKAFNMHQVQLRTLPKFDVQRQNNDTKIKIRCSLMPGILLNTVNTLEALGLDIQQCVSSCFSDFSLQASCSEAADHQTMISSEDMKQVLCRTAGYGGRCL